MRTHYFSKGTHVTDLLDSTYYKHLLKLRNDVSIACDTYFQKLNAVKVDLYLITQSVSSPMGKGSDSKPIPFAFGKEKAYLVDSAQFGLEPLVQKSYKIAYCYLPSFRGENPDYRHLNQFYHCEAEMRGTNKDVIKLVNGLVDHLIITIINGLKKERYMFKEHKEGKTDYLVFKELEYVIGKKYPILTFDEAFQLLKKHGFENLVDETSFGRILSREGECKITELVSNNKLPVWVTNYDRDTIAFYQKPDPKNKESVLNADLLFPPLNGGFCGEIVGSGQRQDSATELAKSIKRQGITHYNNYDWYIDLRNRKDYKTTSGFGLGIERFIAWSLGLSSIADAITYPVLKDTNIL